jgi:TPR repeat protein
MYTHSKISLSDIRTMILCEFPLSTEEIGHQYYDGEGVSKSLEEAYVWYQVAQCAGNHEVDSLVNYLDSKLTTSKCLKLSSRAKHIYTRALRL